MPAGAPCKEKIMKKKLFLVLALALIACSLFALSVSATTVTTVDGEVLEVTTYPDAPAKSTFVNSTNDYVVFDDGFVCPSSYIFKDNTEIPSTGTHRVNLANALDFSFLQEKGKSYTVNNIVELDVPQGITTVCDFVAYALNTLEKITFPSTVTSFGNVAFQNATGLKECVFEHGKTDPITIGANYMFYGCTNLRAFSFPDSVTTLSGEGYIFWKCSNLTAVHLPENLQSVVATRNYAVFDYCGKMYFTSEPFSTSNTAPAKPAVYYFPENLSTFPTNTCAFRDCDALNDVLVFGTGITSITEKYFMQNKSTSTIVFLGDMVEINTSQWIKDNSYNKTLIFANPNDKSGSDFTTYNISSTKSVTFCASESDTAKHLASPKHSSIEEATCYSNEKGVTRCFCNKVLSEGEVPGTMLTEHNYIDDFNCTTPNYCENFGEGKCDKFLDAEALEHIEKHAVAYADGFAKNGLHTVWCDNEGCKALDNEITLGAMISTSGGYSVSGNGGLAGGWTVDTDLVTLFNDYNEKDVQFGIFMVNPSHLASERFMTGYMPNLADGKSGALVVEMTGTEYASFAFQISGFNSEELKKLELVIAAYAYVEGEDVEYIQDADTVCKVTTLDYADGSLYTVTYEKASSELSPVSVEAVIPTVKKENF